MNIININDNSGKLFYIGGVVRDELLGRDSFDIDITYVGNAIEYCSKFGEVVQVNPNFGTVRVAAKQLGSEAAKLKEQKSEGQEGRLVNEISLSEISQVQQPDTNLSTFQPFNPSTENSTPTPTLQPSTIDFASTRSESYPKKGHLPVVEKIGCSLKEDVLRRDFTINALAKSVTTGEIVDYVGGLEDLKNKKLRVLYDESFIDDPTRIIRGLKFSVRFGFDLEEHTKQLQDEYLANINYDMSYKRVKKELIETFNLNSQKAFEKFINEKIYKLVTPNDVEMPKVNVERLVREYVLEGRKVGRQEGKPLKVESGKLKMESLSLYAPSPDGEGWDGVISYDNSETLQSPKSDNDLFAYSPICLFADEKILSKISQEQQTDNSYSSTPLTLYSSNNSHPSIPPYLQSSIWLIYVGVLKDLSRLPLTKTEQKILDDIPKIEPKTDFEIYKAFENKRIETILLYAILKNEKIARHYLDNLRQIKIEITGNDLKNLGIPPSPKYQKIFDEVLKAKLQNPKMTKEDEMDYLKNIEG